LARVTSFERFPTLALSPTLTEASIKAYADMVLKFQVATACFSFRIPEFKLFKITPAVNATKLILFPNYRKVIRNSKFRCLIALTFSFSNYS
jgi:hypothetical protein